MKKILKKSLKKIPFISHPKTALVAKSLYWFSIGIVLGLFFLLSFAFILFRNVYRDVVFPGVLINGVSFAGKSQLYVENYFDTKNEQLGKSSFTFTIGNQIATFSAQELQAGYDSKLLAQQAMSIGRSSDIFSNISLVFQAYLNGINLAPAYTYNNDVLIQSLGPLAKNIYVAPVDAVFTFQNGKVTTFKPSTDGQQADLKTAAEELHNRLPILMSMDRIQNFTIQVPIEILHPKITTGAANNLGIKELIGTGESLFQGSIASRIYNIDLASSRINGTLVAPGDVFSFAKAVGDISSYTGYQQAYVIQNGHTVLGDGGGVCQVSTTIFRAALNAGLPIVERHAHDYRVEYYEEDGPPGIDATVYVPSVDLKFRNDTGHYILIQSAIDPKVLRLTFYIYGTSDGRKVSMTTPVVTNQIPAPPPLYQDDSSLPKGKIVQTDFAAAGATVSFSRTVTKNGKPYINDTYVSHYQPWQAVFLVGTGGS